MNLPRITAFNLSGSQAAKAEPALISLDEQHFCVIADSLATTLAELRQRREDERKTSARGGQQALDRDLEVHRLTSRLRTLQRYGLDLCLGRMDPEDGAEPVYIGRLGLTDVRGRRLLVDWRSPSAEPFFGATHANPMGLRRRRRYRWTDGKVTDYWDEVFCAEDLEPGAALDDQSAFIASLGASRSPWMRDVLGTIAADQDAIIRAGSGGALVVDGGPGTGKTVVALHRAAYLLYSDPKLGHQRGGVLVIGPHQPYLDYVGDVLPSLGEEGVQTCTLSDLVPEGRSAVAETDAEVARLKSSDLLVRGIEAAVRFYEEPPAQTTRIETPWADLELTAADWRAAFAVLDPGTPHNEARDLIWDELTTILFDQLDDEEPSEAEFAQAMQHNRELLGVFNQAWPLLQPTDLVGDLWSVPAYLKLAAPHLTRDEISRLQRERPQAWTESDLPLLDAARRRLGDPEASRRRRRRQAEIAAQRTQLGRVIDELIAADDSELLLMTSLRHSDLQDALIDTDALPQAAPEPLAGPFAHIVVDEAQELTDAQWQMVLARCPSHSLTIVGDRAQARHGFAESWSQRLARIGLDRSRLAALSINYRTPAEVMAAAEPVIRAVRPDANVPTSIRTSGIPVRRGSLTELESVLDRWLARHPDGIGCVIASEPWPANVPDRIRTLTPTLAKGLEFDLVVLLETPELGGGIEGAVDRYVAMTRATQELVILG